MALNAGFVTAVPDRLNLLQKNTVPSGVFRRHASRPARLVNYHAHPGQARMRGDDSAASLIVGD